MIIQKIWLTLVVLLPVAVCLIMLDEGDTVISAIAITEILAFIGFTIGVVIATIWSA